MDENKEGKRGKRRRVNKGGGRQRGRKKTPLKMSLQINIPRSVKIFFLKKKISNTYKTHTR